MEREERRKRERERERGEMKADTGAAKEEKAEYKTLNVHWIWMLTPCGFSPPPPAATVCRPACQHAGLSWSQDASTPPAPQYQWAHLSLITEE